MRGGARKYAMHLAGNGGWPPTAPVFRMEGESIMRRLLRHLWLENAAGFGSILMIEAWAGVGKSVAAWPIGRLLDSTFDLDSYLYEVEEFDKWLDDGAPYTVAIVDEAIGTFMFSRNWARVGQKNTMQSIWKKVRYNKKILVLVVQNARWLDAVLREDVVRWYVKIKQRDPVTQVKYAELWHAERLAVKASGIRGSYGYAAGDVVVFQFGQSFTIPAVPQAVVDAYNGRREKGLVVYES